MGIEEVLARTVTPSPMVMVDQGGIQELSRIITSGVDNGAAQCVALLEHLKPFVKSDEAKVVLASLRILEELMWDPPPALGVTVASEEWMRRLGKIAHRSTEPIVVRTVLQLLADWRDWFGEEPQMQPQIDRKCRELEEAGLSLPTPRPPQVGLQSAFRPEAEQAEAERETIDPEALP